LHAVLLLLLLLLEPVLVLVPPPRCPTPCWCGWSAAC